MGEVAQEFGEEPGLDGVGDSAVGQRHLGFVEDLRPGDVVEGDLAEFAFVHGDGVFAGGGGDFVGQGDDGVEALVLGDVEIVLDLVPA